MEREKIDNLYDLLDDFYYAYKDELIKEKYLSFVAEESEYVNITFDDVLIALQEKVQEKLNINSCWNIKGEK